jgi:hypothetical protein
VFRRVSSVSTAYLVAVLTGLTSATAGEAGAVGVPTARLWDGPARGPVRGLAAVAGGLGGLDTSAKYSKRGTKGVTASSARS